MHDQHPYILLVDDEPHFIYLIQRYAARSGYQLVHTHRSRELVALTHQRAPAAIILDLSLPELDMRLVLANLRSDSITQHIPVVLCGSSELDGARMGSRGRWITG